jgi:Tol biopolymer transport system component
MKPVAFVVVIAAATAPGSASPSANLLAYQSNVGGDTEIYVTRVGHRPTELTHNRVEDRLPSWSPDGRRILFIRGTPDGDVSRLK